MDSTVSVPVKITEQPKSVPSEPTKDNLGLPIRIRCVARGRPAPEIKWKHNGRPVFSHSVAQMGVSRVNMCLTNMDQNCENQR